MAELMLLAGLRQLKMIMKKELEEMSILIDINRHTIFGPIHREGLKEGLEKGREEGLDEGARLFAADLLTQRFGKLPPAHAKRIQNMNQAELATLRTRIFEARSLKDLFA
jgi:flagellar biosynthesis/type III secretory pathway protein FliH